MPAPFSTKDHKEWQIKTMVEEIRNAILAQADGQEGLIKVDLTYSVNGHGLRPWGDYGQGAYRDFTIAVGGKKWDGLTKQDLAAIKRALKVDGFETKMDDMRVEMYEFSPTIEVPRSFIKFGKPCDEFTELQKLVSKKYGINLKPQDLYMVRMSNTIINREVGERTYAAYAPYRCKQLIEKIKSFGRKHTTCKIAIIEDFECGLECRAVWLDIQPKVKK